MIKSPLKLFSLAVIAFCLFEKTTAQAFKLVRDINQQQDANPLNPGITGTPFAVTNGKAFFTADDGIHGEELWMSDGTTAGTVLVKDIATGPTGAGISFIYAYSNKAYFFTPANTSFNYLQLWVSDGTAAGTQMIKDSASTRFAPLYAGLNNELYFTVSNGNTGIGSELWKTDGTKNGTKKMVASDGAGFNASPIQNLLTLNNRVFYTTKNGQILWSTDGTPGNTVKFTFNGYQDNISTFTSLELKDNKLHFYYNQKYWESGGDPASTIVVGDPPPNGVALIGKDMFSFIRDFDYGYTLARQDATAAGGYVKIKKVTPYDQPVNAIFLRNNNDNLLFFYFIDAQKRPQLWATDGTTDGTVLLLDDSAACSSFFTHGKNIYFTHSANDKGNELWVTDGTVAGTKMEKDINPGIYGSNPGLFTLLGSSMLFSANDNVAGVELWSTDGTNAGTYMVKNINTSSTSSANPQLANNFDIDTIDNKLLFTAYDGIHGLEVWGTDGTAAGTTMLKDAYQGSNPATWYPNHPFFDRSFTRFKGSDYYFSQSQANAIGLFKTNGTSSNTSFISNVYIWAVGTNPLGIGATGKYLFGILGPNNIGSYINQPADSVGSKLFVYDGLGQPVIIKHGFFSPGAFSYTNDGPSIVLPSLGGNICFFAASPFYDNKGIELWKSDGTATGTQMVKNFYIGQNLIERNPIGYTKQYKEQIFFIMNTGSGPGTDNIPNTNYLWKTDLSAAGTQMVTKQALAKEPMEIANNKLYFVAQNYNGRQLWVTDNTEAGTYLVKSMPGVSGYSSVKNLTEFKNELYFLFVDSQISLWKTDGTDAGTIKVKDNVSDLVKGNGNLYYVSDKQIWQFDGTVTGTKQVDMTGLEGVSSLSRLVYAGGKLYISGYTYQYGNELYVSGNIALPVTMLSFTGRLQGSNGMLQWATVNEQQNSHFNLQRSLHGNGFITIGTINAQNGGKQNDYTYVDAGVTSLGVDKVYYRLQQVDLDGKSTYSKTVQLDVPVKNLYVAPNPATTSTAIYSQVNIQGAVIQLADINGKVLYRNKTNIIAGGKVTISLAGYAKGLYTVTIQSAGIKQQEFKVMIE